MCQETPCCGASGTTTPITVSRGFTIEDWKYVAWLVRSQPEQQGERMYQVTVEDSFAAGHYLRNYKGKCENPHGHNYKVRVTLQGESLDKAGLLLDFKDLKEVMKHVIDRLDHQMLNDIVPFTELNPSAENLARYFFDQTNGRLQSLTTGRVTVKDVTIWETDSTTARYSE
jgi:6-pyruvoyltetrahydropterin/6-carboxytetrahydropterin synthase